MKWMVSSLLFCTCNGILGRGQPGRMRWILLCIMPQVQDRSLDLLSSSPARYHCTTDAPPRMMNRWSWCSISHRSWWPLVYHCIWNMSAALISNWWHQLIQLDAHAWEQCYPHCSIHLQVLRISCAMIMASYAPVNSIVIDVCVIL